MSASDPAGATSRGRLADLRIRDFGVIDDAVVELTDGLNVLTGETGAGKTMVVSGLGLLLGARAESGLTRPGASAAVVEGTVLLPPGHPALARAADAGANTDDGLLLARSVGADGRSRAYVGGRQTPVGVLGELGRLLVAVHGQADQWRLRRPEQHRSLLDAFGGPGVRDAADRYRAAYDEAVRVRGELTALEELDRDRLVQAAVLRAGLEELEALDPAPGEDEALAAEEGRLAYADALRDAAGRAHALLAGDDTAFGGSRLGTGHVAGTGAADLLVQVRAALEHAAGHDPRLRPLAGRAAELAYLAADLSTEVAGYVEGVEGDPNRLAWVQQRRADLTRFTRGYGGSVDAALAWGAQAAVRLDRLESVTDRIEAHRARLAALTGELATAAGALSRARRDAARRLAKAITAELAQLAMPQAVVEVEVSPIPAAADEPGLVLPDREDAADRTHHGLRCGPHGVDDVEIRLAANPGTPPRTVAKAASGGELSRVMLAIEVVTHLAGGETPESAEGGEHLTTFVFDEIDAGVGGAAALAIGARLAALARHTQVVVVTHLAQVAAYADRHITIRKTVSTGDIATGAPDAPGVPGAPGPQVTTSDLAVLDEKGRLRELARMMAGSADSDVAIEHARELLTAARADARGGAESGAATRNS